MRTRYLAFFVTVALIGQLMCSSQVLAAGPWPAGSISASNVTLDTILQEIFAAQRALKSKDLAAADAALQRASVDIQGYAEVEKRFRSRRYAPSIRPKNIGGLHGTKY